MFDIGWSEMLLIIVVMIVVIGPKELPRALHTLGQWVGQVRRIARQFQDSIEQMAQESGVNDIKKQIERAGAVDLDDRIVKTIDPRGEIKQAFDIKAPSFDESPSPPEAEKPASPEAEKPASPEAAKDETKPPPPEAAKPGSPPARGERDKPA